MRYIKSFEGRTISIPKDPDIYDINISDDFLFTISEEDIEDYLLPLTDGKFEIRIEKRLIDINDSLGMDRNIKNVNDDNIRGAYLIKIVYKYEENEEEGGVRLTYTVSQLKLLRILIPEIIQLSARVESLEWEFVRHEVTELLVLVVCPRPHKK